MSADPGRPVDEVGTDEMPLARRVSARRSAGTVQPEAKLVRAAIQRINDEPGGFARKVHQTAVTGGGEPDVDACVRGRALKLEGKRPGQRPTGAQTARMRRWAAAGALVGWFTSVEHVEQLLRRVDDWKWINPLDEPGAPDPPE